MLPRLICNNSQTTPGITMHELPRNRAAVRQKWIKFIQFKRADFLAAPPICVASTSVSAISQTPWNTTWGLLRSWHDVPVLFQNPAWQAQKHPCGSLGQSISFVFGARIGHFAATPQSDIVGIWSCDLGAMATLSVWQKMPSFHAFITLRSQFHLHHRSQRALTEIVSKITPNLGLVL